MNPWLQRTWAPDGQSTRLVTSQYELLCREAEALCLRVELRIVDCAFVELGVSDGRCVDLYGLRDLPRASRVLREYLARETA
jgi:hypothetical protein